MHEQATAYVTPTARAPARRSLLRPVLEVLVTLGLLSLTIRLVDLSALRAHLNSLDRIWIVLGVSMCIPQLAGAAMRWSFTAARIGVPLSFGHALREYYVSSLLNQLLPTGVAGDVLRIKRHGDDLGGGSKRYGLCLRAIVLERLAGQTALWLVIALSAPLWLSRRSNLLPLTFGALCLFIALAAGLIVYARRSQSQSRLHQWLREADGALFARGAWAVQLSTSSLGLVGAVGMFACGARALGAELSLGDVLRIAPLVLASMAMPVSFAGWGLREAATAALFKLSGLDPALGAATSIMYGLMGLLGSAPGVLFVRKSRQEP